MWWKESITNFQFMRNLCVYYIPEPMARRYKTHNLFPAKDQGHKHFVQLKSVYMYSNSSQYLEWLFCNWAKFEIGQRIGQIVGLFFEDLSVILWLGSRGYPISEIEVARLGFEPWTPCSLCQELDYLTTTAPDGRTTDHESMDMTNILWYETHT